LTLKYFTRLEDSAGEPWISFGRVRIAARMVVDHDKCESGKNDHGLEYLARVGEGFVKSSVTDGNNPEVL
jgi:hypothetical protein